MISKPRCMQLNAYICMWWANAEYEGKIWVRKSDTCLCPWRVPWWAMYMQISVENWAHLIYLIYHDVGVFALVQHTGWVGHNLERLEPGTVRVHIMLCLPHTALAMWLNPELQSPCYFSPELFSLLHAIIAIFHSPVLGSLKLKKSPELLPSLLSDTWDPGGKCSAQYAGIELNNSLLVWGWECN